MMFQIVASLLLALIALYAYSQLRFAPFVGLAGLVIALVGEVFVLFPELAIDLAHLVGVGRGVDLVFYLWILLSLVVSLNLYLKLRTTNEMLASLVRDVALREAGVQPRGKGTDLPQ